jgi:hypothetical protein
MSGDATQVDAELTRWRERLATASRNVSELSELPEYAAVRTAAKGTGRLGEEARALIATMDELWRGVLLIGDVLERADQARHAGSRFWRGDDGAQKAMELLRGPSISVDLADTPVLHRRLLSGPRATAVVPPGTLLETMDAAFDRAREQLTRIAEADARAAALRSRLRATATGLTSAGDLIAELDATGGLDALDRLDAMEALAPRIDEARALADRAATEMAAAERNLAALNEAARVAEESARECAAAVTVVLPTLDEAAFRELAAWLDRIGHTLAEGRARAALVGLANWQALRERLAAEVGSRHAAALAALQRRDDLRALARVQIARQRAVAAGDPGLEALARRAREALDRTPIDLDGARQALATWQAALAGR